MPLPKLTTPQIEHLLRRTEFVARPQRVADLLVRGTREAQVDDVLDVVQNGTPPPSVVFTPSNQNWQRGEELTHFWFDRMAHDAPRPIQEKLAFFWHGHFCSEFGKVGSAELMREQIDLFRHDGMTDLRNIAKQMSTQVAMLRYLDNNQNKQSSPNQNFARELMELFLLGVGNYTEADVEAGTAAWTGHTDQWDTDAHVWKPEWHDSSTKSFLGRTINVGKSDAAQRLHGPETIDVILGNGSVPSGASVVPNRGRPTKEVAVEFISKKLWYDFAGTEPTGGAIAAMSSAALSNNLQITPWSRAMLMHDDFYAAPMTDKYVRSPVEFVVALLVATGMRSAQGTPLWLMEGMGQRPLFPPNVSGWKHNSYWVNASAMGQRTATAQSFGWRTMQNYWNDTGVDHGLLRLAGGTMARTHVERTVDGVADKVVSVEVLDEMLDLMRFNPTSSTYDALEKYAQDSTRWERIDLLALILMAPDLSVA